MINETRGTGFGATHSLAYRRGDRSCIKGQTQCAGRVCNREHSLCLGFMKARAGPASLRQREELTQWLSSARQRGSSRNQWRPAFEGRQSVQASGKRHVWTSEQGPDPTGLWRSCWTCGTLPSTTEEGCWKVSWSNATYEQGFESWGQLQQAKVAPEGIPSRGDRVNSAPEGKSSRYWGYSGWPGMGGAQVCAGV